MSQMNHICVNQNYYKSNEEKLNEIDKEDNSEFLELNKEIKKQKDTINKYQNAIISIVKNDVDTIDFMPMRRNLIYLLKTQIAMYEVLIIRKE